jgi:hypothetical protein
MVIGIPDSSKYFGKKGCMRILTVSPKLVEKNQN